MTSLKALGMGDKNKMETVIGEEAERFCKIAEKMVADSRDGVLEVWVKQWIKFERCADKKNTLIFQMNCLFLTWVNNVILRLTTGTSSGQTDKELKGAVHAAHVYEFKWIFLFSL